VVERVEIRCGEVTRFTVPMSIEDGHWAVLRLADPDIPDNTPAPLNHPADNHAIAYTSPWFLQP
jgi:hypothetical protein